MAGVDSFRLIETSVHSAHCHMRYTAQRALALSSSASIFNIWQLRGTRPAAVAAAAFLLHHETCLPQQQRLCIGRRRKDVFLSLSFRSVFSLLLSEAPLPDSWNPCRRRIKKTSNGDRRRRLHRHWLFWLFLFCKSTTKGVSNPPDGVKVFTLTSQGKDLISCLVEWHFSRGGKKRGCWKRGKKQLIKSPFPFWKHLLKKRQPASSCGFDLFSNCVSCH